MISNIPKISGQAMRSHISDLAFVLLPHELLSVGAGTLRFKVQVFGARVDARLKGVVGQRPTRAKCCYFLCLDTKKVTKEKSRTHDKQHMRSHISDLAFVLLPYELLSVDAGTLRFKVQVYGARVDARLKGVVGQRPTRAKIC